MASIASSAGSIVGGMVGNSLSSSKHRSTGQRLSNLLVQTSTYGKAIPKIFGHCLLESMNILNLWEGVKARSALLILHIAIVLLWQLPFVKGR